MRYGIDVIFMFYNSCMLRPFTGGIISKLKRVSPFAFFMWSVTFMGLSPRPLQRRGSHSGRFYIAYYFYLFWALPKGRAFGSRFFLIYLLINLLLYWVPTTFLHIPLPHLFSQQNLQLGLALFFLIRNTWPLDAQNNSH